MKHRIRFSDAGEPSGHPRGTSKNVIPIQRIESAWKELGKLDAGAKLELLRQFRSEQSFIFSGLDVLSEKFSEGGAQEEFPLHPLALLIWLVLSQARGPLNPVQPDSLKRAFTRNANYIKQNSDERPILQAFAREEFLGRCRQLPLLAFVCKILTDADDFEVTNLTCTGFCWLKAFIDTLDKVRLR